VVTVRLDFGAGLRRFRNEVVAGREQRKQRDEDEQADHTATEELDVLQIEFTELESRVSCAGSVS